MQVNGGLNIDGSVAAYDFQTSYPDGRRGQPFYRRCTRELPAFKYALSDIQVAELAGYMRQRFAPGKPQWADLSAAVARVRAAPSQD